MVCAFVSYHHFINGNNFAQILHTLKAFSHSSNHLFNLSHIFWTWKLFLIATCCQISNTQGILQ